MRKDQRHSQRVLIALTHSRSRVVYRPLPQDDPMQRRPDIRLTRERLDREPTVPLREGLQRTIAHFEQRLREAA